MTSNPHNADDKSGKSSCFMFWVNMIYRTCTVFKLYLMKELKYPLPVHKSPMLDPILSQMNPANLLTSCIFNVIVNINLLCALCSLKWYYCFIFRKHFVCIDVFLPACYIFPAYFILKVLDRRQEGVRIRATLPKHNVSYCVSL